MLTALSGMGSLDGLIFVVTSNSTEPFNGPMRRRFDLITEIPLPSIKGRTEYLQKMLFDDGVTEKYVETLSERTAGWSFDDLRGLVTAALGVSVQSDNIDERSLEHALSAMARRRHESQD